MTDLWAFLMQTLTASGAALLLLLIKALFRDKLSPRWQFASWGVLALVLLMPAGIGGRYVLFNWPFVVETLKSALTGEYGTLAHVTAPIPLPPHTLPATLPEWLFAVYAAGVAFLLLRYLIAYVRLRAALRKSPPADDSAIRAAAERYSQTGDPSKRGRYCLPVCPAVRVEGLPSAFVCGVLRPVLALPSETDEKVLLHELLHLKHHDVLWGLTICLFRCLHWCNPLLWYCADLAGNDLESLCDQRVLERLAGEERRDYGRILLSMADEKYARAPGPSSLSNGGRNIRRRIEAIARFRRYPAGMALASVCIVLILAQPLLTGARAQAIYPLSATAAIMSSARTVWCTTFAGAFDTYAKAVLTGSLPCRAMCAPLGEQNALAAELEAGREADFELPAKASPFEGYQIYNLEQDGENAWEGILAVALDSPPAGECWDEWGHVWIAAQAVRAERQGRRWVVLPLEPFRALATSVGSLSEYDGEGLPAWCYEAQSGDFTIRIEYRTSAEPDNFRKAEQPARDWSPLFKRSVFDITPRPDASFGSRNLQRRMVWAAYTGAPEQRDNYTSIKVSSVPLRADAEAAALPQPGDGNSFGSSSHGTAWASRTLDKGWQSPLFLGGSGGNHEISAPPDCYAVKLYLNGHAPTELTLLPVEGAEPYARP